MAVQKARHIGKRKKIPLELIAGTLPTRGIVEKAGRVGALLELGRV